MKVRSSWDAHRVPRLTVEMSRPEAQAIVDEIRAVKPGGLTPGMTDALARILSHRLGAIRAEEVA